MCFFFLNICSLGFTGYIYRSQTDIFYQNAKYAKNFTFVFSLESGISSTDYFYLKFPFSLGTFTSASTIPMATITLLSNDDNSIEVLYPAEGSSNMNYFLNFNQEILANTWYSLKLIASDSSVLLQNEGFQGIVEFYTVSTTLENPIYYDSNTVFDVIQLAPAPSSEISGNCSIISESLSQINNPDASFPTYFDLLINDANAYGSTFQFLMNDQSFIFYSMCALMSCTIGVDSPSCTYNITNNIQYSCNINLFNPSELDLTISPLTKGMVFRVKTYIKNPLIITQSTATSYITVKQISSVGTVILNTIQISCGLKVNQIIMSSNIMQLFWGLESTSLVNNAGCPIVLYKLPASPKIIAWNSIKLIFSLAEMTPFLPLQIKVDLTSSYQDILLGSISTNVPLNAGSIMKCQILTQYLYCGNFSNLAASSSYYIAFKITIQNSAPSSLNIGGIQFIDVTTSVAYTNLLYPSISLPVLINNEYLDLASSGINIASGGGGYAQMNYNQMISYDDITMNYNYGKADNGLGIGDLISTSPSSQASIKYPTASQSTQKIIIFLQVSSIQLCQNIVNRCYTTSSNADHTMMKIVFNNNMLGISSLNFPKGVELIDSIFADVISSSNIRDCASNSWCSGYNTYSSQTSIINQIFTLTASSTLYNNYYHVTVVCQTPSGASQKQCHQIVGRAATYGSGNNIPGFTAFAFRGVTITTYPTFYVDNYVFDYIFCFKYQSYITSGTANIASTQESTWTLSTSGIVPGYIITKGFYKPYMRVSWINYNWKSGDGITSDSFLPFVLRVGGQLSSSTESSSVFAGNMIVIFIGSSIDISAYKEGSPLESATDTITCGNSNGTNLIGRIYPRIGSVTTQQDVWTNEPRIELDYQITADSYFNFYLPLQPTSTSGAISSLNSLTLAIVKKNSTGMTILGVYRLVGSVDQNSYSFNPMVAAAQKFDVTQGFWAGIDLTNQNCMNSGSSPGLDSSVTLQPNAYYSTSFKVLTQIGSNSNPDCLNNQEGSTANGWGTSFTMASDINIFSSVSSMSWDFEGIVNGVATNLCVFFSYNLPLINKRIYSVICPIDTYSGIISPTIGGVYKYLELDDIVWPWWWGSSSIPTNLIRYGWSRSDGVLVAYRSENKNVYSQTLCLTSDFIILSTTSYMEYSLTVTPYIAMTLNSTTNLNNFFVRMNINASTINHLEFERCVFLYEIYSFDCEVSVSNTYVDFYITYNGDTSITFNQSYIINIYVSSDNSQFQDWYYLNIYSPSGYYMDNFLIETCSAAHVATNHTASPLVTDLLVSNLSFMPCRDVLTNFIFTFNTLRRNIYYGTQIQINLGFLTLPVIGQYDLRCRLYEGYNITFLSYKWSSIQYISPSTLIINPQYDVINDYIFSIKCSGSKGPTVINNQSNFTAVIRKIATLIPIQISNNITAPYNISQPYAFRSLTFTKNLSFIGMEANYFFKFEIYRGNIDTDGRIVISFPKRIPSLLNSYGFFKCYLDNISVYCEIIDENLLSVTCNIVINSTLDQTYSLDIYGILQPNMTNSYLFPDTTIGFMIDDDSDISNGILSYGELNDNFDYMNNSLTNGIGILDLNISNNITRELSDAFLRIKLGVGAITQGNIIYLKLDLSFNFALMQNNNISCFLYNEIDSNYSNNLLNAQCIIIDILKIQMTVLSSDPYNSIPQIYQLFIRNLSTPIDFITPANPLLEIFYIIPGTITTLYRSSSGFMNNTFPTFYVSNTSLNLLWYYYDASSASYFLQNTTYLDVYIGRYTTNIGLGLTNGTFNITYNYTLIDGNDSSNFVIYPSYNPSIIQATPVNGFLIAGNSNATPGIYFLSFQKSTNGDPNSWTSPIPPLLVNLKADKCQINTFFDYYELPIGKATFQMYLDFSPCIPLDDVIISANVSFGYKEYNIYLWDGQNLVQTLNQTVQFQNGVYPQIYFILKNQDIYLNLTSNLSGTVSFQVYGTNAASFLPPNDVQVKLVDAIAFKTPPIPSIPSVQIDRNTVGITIKCSQPSQIFYSLRTSVFDLSFSYTTIQAKTENLNIYQTQRDYLDPYWTIYGFTIQNSYSSLFLNVSDLRSSAKYYFCFFCLNRYSVISPIGPNTSWVQSDNGGRITKISFTFNNSISSILSNAIACSLTEIFSVSNLQVSDSNGTICLLQRRLLTTNMTNNTETNQSNYLFFVLPDYQLAVESIQDYVKLRIEEKGLVNFGNFVLNNTDMRSSFPMLFNLTYKIYLDPEIYVPKANFSTLNTTNSSISFFLSLNESGFIVISISSNFSIKPAFANLKKGLDNNGNNLQIWEVININQGDVFFKNFTNLNSSTNYYLWHSEWTDDPSILANYGGVNEIIMETNLTMISFGSLNKSKMWLGLLILVLIVVG